MLNQTMLYSILYALAARDGREDALFGTCAPLAQEAFTRSLAGPGFPEIWFEVPLLGEPWFDLHALTAHETLSADQAFEAERTGGYPEVFSWFARQGSYARQLALSYDVSSGCIDAPAVQLLTRSRDTQGVCSFLEAAGRGDAVPAYRAFVERIPQDWFACYTGVFPSREADFVRVECIPPYSDQRHYAVDAAFLEAELRQAGLAVQGDTMIPRCQALAQAPFQLEFQFNVLPDGSTGTTFGASARFSAPSDTETYESFEVEGAAGELMAQVEAWGLADDRWRLFPDATFAVSAARDGEGITLFNFPTFLKLRWRDGEPLDAKAYFMGGSQ